MTDPIAGVMTTPNWHDLRLRPDAEGQYALWVDMRNGNKTISAATPGTAAGTLLLAANSNRVLASFYNGGTVDVYLGKSGVSTALYAYKLAAGVQFVDDVSRDEWYAITTTGSGNVMVTEVA